MGWIAKKRVRQQRFDLWNVAAGGLRSGLVSAGIASWLLDVSDSRIRYLIALRVLQTRCVAGQRLLLLQSVYDYSRLGKRV